MYGYRLPETDEKIIYYTLNFHPMFPTAYTYPNICVRPHLMGIVEQADQLTTMRMFLTDLTRKMPTVCEEPLAIHSKLGYAVAELTTWQKNIGKPNISSRPIMPTGLVPIESALQSVTPELLFTDTQISRSDLISSQSSGNISLQTQKSLGFWSSQRTTNFVGTQLQSTQVEEREVSNHTVSAKPLAGCHFTDQRNCDHTATKSRSIQALNAPTISNVALVASRFSSDFGPAGNGNAMRQSQCLQNQDASTQESHDRHPHPSSRPTFILSTPKVRNNHQPTPEDSPPSYIPFSIPCKPKHMASQESSTHMTQPARYKPVFVAKPPSFSQNKMMPPKKTVQHLVTKSQLVDRAPFQGKTMGTNTNMKSLKDEPRVGFSSSGSQEMSVLTLHLTQQPRANHISYHQRLGQNIASKGPGNSPGTSTSGESLSKKPRSRPQIQADINVEALACENNLEKVNSTTLINYLRQKGVPCKTKDKKGDLIDKVKNFLQTDH